MKDLTRNPFLRAHATPDEMQRYINNVIVRGGLDWIPGMVYTDTLLATSPITLGGGYTDVLEISFTPRVRVRTSITGMLTLQGRADGDTVLCGAYCTPLPLGTSGTDQQANPPDDYCTQAVNDRDYQVVHISNSFDLAAGVTYSVKIRAMLTNGVSTSVITGCSMTLYHFPLPFQAGTKNTLTVEVV